MLSLHAVTRSAELYTSALLGHCPLMVRGLLILVSHTDGGVKACIAIPSTI